MNLKEMQGLVKVKDPSLLLMLEIWEDRTGQRLMQLLQSMMIAKLFARATWILFCIIVVLGIVFHRQGFLDVKNSIPFLWTLTFFIFLFSLNWLFLFMWRKQVWLMRDHVFGKPEELDCFLQTISILEKQIGKLNEHTRHWPRNWLEIKRLNHLKIVAEDILTKKATVVKYLQGCPHYQEVARDMRASFVAGVKYLNILTGSSLDYRKYFGST